MRQRPELQALRAVAIAGVLGIHLIGRPSGAALGMDVFFVLSGFLITALLLREFQATGRISLRDFYARRARRILPAAVLVIVVTGLAAIPILGVAHGRWLAEHGLAALFFMENWVLVGNGWDQSYLTDPYSPFQQYWSLSVEEQFYLGWPLLLLVLLTVPARRRQRAVVVGALLLLIVLSLYASVTVENLYVVYHSTTTRIWQLAVGALLAVLPWQPSVTARTRGLIVGGAFAAIAVAFVTVSGPGVYPGSIGSLAVVALTGVVIAYGDGPASGAGRLIAWRPVQYLGDLSYSLYLWNWPIIVLLFALIDKSRGTILVAGALILLVSVLSFHLVEQPIRRSNWLGGRPPAGSGPTAEVPAVDVREVRDGAGQQTVELRADDRR